MKIPVIIFCLLISFQILSAQNKIPDSLRSELARAGNPAERFHVLNKISDFINFSAGNIDSASCVEMFQIASELDNDSLLAVSYNLIGLYFFSKGDNNTSLEYLFKGIPLAEKSNDKRRISSLYFDISTVYFNLMNYDEAYKNVIKGGENLPDKSYPYYDYMLVQYERNLTQYFILTGQADSALHFVQELTKTSSRINSVLFEYAALYLNGSVYAMMGNNNTAEEYFIKALDITDSIELEEEKLKFYESYIEFLLRNDRISDAYDQSHKLMKLAGESDDDNLKMSGAHFLKEVYERMNKTDSAYYYSKMEMNMSDRIFSQKNIDKVQALAFNEKLRIMEENDRKMEEEYKRKKQIEYLLLAFGILTTVILYILLGPSIISNPRLIEFFGVMSLLIVFEFLNLVLHPVLEELTDHNPLLMLLALVCIAALLVPLHHKAEKWTTAYLVEKNKLIRLARKNSVIKEKEANETV
ncbi:MAG: hypothetical protein JSS91_03140 [Bacteroidetes bacterium]|nr:hypothetical protein [Bacteroidota bacterium]